VVSRDPEAFAHGLWHPGGGEWDVGGAVWRHNPRHLVPKRIFHVVKLWNRCRSGMGGFAALPDAGGINQQPAWLMNAFSVLEAADERLRAAEKPEGMPA
jgi:hypothetical protein